MARETDYLDEVVIIDDGHSPDTDAVVKELGTKVRLIVEPGPQRGRAAARNAGAKCATGDLLVFIDDDVLVSPGFISKHASAQSESSGLVRGRIRELIGAAACKDFAIGGTGFPPIDRSQLTRSGFDPTGYRLLINSLEQAIEGRFLNRDDRLPLWLASAGPNFSIPKELWRCVGGQDEQFGCYWGCEDLEFTLRLVTIGHRIIFAPDAIGYHLSHVQPDRWIQHYHTLGLFSRLHPIPAVELLGELIGPNGNARRYLESLDLCHQIRSA